MVAVRVQFFPNGTFLLLQIYAGVSSLILLFVDVELIFFTAACFDFDPAMIIMLELMN